MGSEQQIRPSQFITTYGPGSILESPSGPVVIPTALEFFKRFTLPSPTIDDFEISEQRLTSSVLQGTRIARIPSNDELGLANDRVTYPTIPFPNWSVCTAHLDRGEQVLHKLDERCEKCGNGEPSRTDRARAGRQAVRFVLACKAGHLSDVDWIRAVHRDKSCNGTQFLWRGGARSLQFSSLECLKCGAKEDLDAIHRRTHRCHGERPELSRTIRGVCTEKARISQRGASNLFLPTIHTALTLGDSSQALYQILTARTILERLQEDVASGVTIDESHFRKRIIDNAFVSISDATRNDLRSADWSEIDRALTSILNPEFRASPGNTHADLKEAELRFLQHAADHGVPTVQSSSPGSPPILEVRKSLVRIVPRTFSQFGLRVTPVSRLRVVMAQSGFQRFNGEECSTAFETRGSNWIPGVELFGEGIFLDYPEAPVGLRGDRARAWRALPADASSSTNPLHIWWHTLSHRLIRSLSVHSGYSSASIRERVYVGGGDPDRISGGLLLFAVQPGGDGTLGGLVEMAHRFEEVLGGALDDLGNCSNDPICEESAPALAGGAACYSCLLASETSCEAHNKGLDRLLLAEALP